MSFRFLVTQRLRVFPPTAQPAGGSGENKQVERRKTGRRLEVESVRVEWVAGGNWVKVVHGGRFGAAGPSFGVFSPPSMWPFIGGACSESAAGLCVLLDVVDRVWICVWRHRFTGFWRLRVQWQSSRGHAHEALGEALDPRQPRLRPESDRGRCPGDRSGPSCQAGEQGRGGPAQRLHGPHAGREPEGVHRGGDSGGGERTAQVQPEGVCVRARSGHGHCFFFF